MSDENQTQTHNPFLLGNRTYDFVKKLVQIVLPAAGTLYFALAQIWGFGYVEQVSGTILAVSTFLGVCLGISSAQYTASGRAFDGQLMVAPMPGGPPRVTGLNFDGLPEELEGKKSITLKVQHKAPVEVSEEVPEEYEPPESPKPPHSR